MLRFSYKPKIMERVKAKCERHPRYDPERDGRGSIKGGCSTCCALYDLQQARLSLDSAHRGFLSKPIPGLDPPSRATSLRRTPMTSHQTQPCNPRVSRRSLGFLIAREPGGRVRSLPLHPSLSLRAEKGQTRALKPQQLFTSQTYAAQVYRSELAVRLKDLGYTVERGEYGQPEIQGYTREYMEASSPRREQVKDHLRAEGLEGAAAAQIAAHRTRDSKEQLPAEEVLRQHKEAGRAVRQPGGAGGGRGAYAEASSRSAARLRSRRRGRASPMPATMCSSARRSTASGRS